MVRSAELSLTPESAQPDSVGTITHRLRTALTAQVNVGTDLLPPAFGSHDSSNSSVGTSPTPARPDRQTYAQKAGPAQPVEERLRYLPPARMTGL